MNSTQMAMPWLDHSSLLNPAPMVIETGLQRLEGGPLQVSVRTDLHGCKGRMLDWWFKFFETTQHIKWWHPVDHVEHRGWDEHWKRGENYYGASIHAVESLAEIPPVAAKLKFHDPVEVYGEAALKDAFGAGAVSAIIAARIGFGDNVKMDVNKDPITGQMLHVARDTSWGCVLRSRFVLGLEPGAEHVPEKVGLALMQHCYTEFTFLSRMLASLYYGERANGEEVPMPW
ncbi:DAPG hydrolase family protein [Cupriavidus basilensis]|nr:hypothetical protein [Cupriavidus basilensis]